MIKALKYLDGGQVEEIDDLDDIDTIRQSPCFIWADVTESSAEDTRRILEEFELTQLALQDLQSMIDDHAEKRRRPRLTLYDTHTFVVAFSSDMSPVNMFIGRDWIVTFHDEDDQKLWVDDARTRFENQPVHDVPTLTWCILDTIVDCFQVEAEELGKRVVEIDDSLFADKHPDDVRETHKRLIGIRRDLVELHHRIAPLEDVVEELLDESKPDWARCARLYRGLRHKVKRTGEHIQRERDLIEHASDALQANAANHMNEVMRRMTAWGSILLGATLIAGIYGMNFENMPETDWRLGYPVAIVAMLLLSVVLIVTLRKKKWL